MSNQGQVKKIYTLLGKNNLRDEKENIVSAFTAGRTNSVRKMKESEAAALIGHLVSLDPTDNSSTKMRNKIISMGYEMRWTKPSSSGVNSIDMDHINNWCISKGYLHKKLDDYTYKELPKLVSQFEEVYKSYLNSI